MKTIASLFTGGGLAEIGAQMAGFIPLWGVEIDDDIAQVARDNGLHVITGDVRQVDPTTLQSPDHLHASPPCPNFSQAKTGGVETREDVELAEAVVRFLETMTPRTFTLENVSMYRFSESWRLIQNALDRLGYWMNVQNHLNMVNYGVPQTRKRMIVRAIRGGFLPPLPEPVEWRGWYAAIEDLIPGLPDSEFAPWQLARMPAGLLDSMLVDSAGYPDESGERVPVMRGMDEPANTIVANHARRPMRALIVDSCNAGQTTPTVRLADEPTFTVVANAGDKGMPCAAVPGRVVRMTPRALSRFQSIKDDYILPDSATLAVKIIGNAVPPLFAARLLEPFA